MQMKNMKWAINLAADCKRRFGSASGRGRMAGAAALGVAPSAGSSRCWFSGYRPTLPPQRLPTQRR